MKILLLLEVFCIGFSCAGNIYCMHHAYNRWIIDFPMVCLAIFALFSYVVLYDHHLNRGILFLGITIIFSTIALYLISSLYFHLGPEVNLLENENFLSVILIIRTLIVSVIIIMMITLYKKIYSKYHTPNIYFKKIRFWSFFGVLSFFLMIPNRLFKALKISSNNFYMLGFILSYLLILLFILFRPKFLNRAGLKIILSKAFNRNEQTHNINTDFEFQFYTKCYYLQAKATLEEFGKMINLTPDLLNKYIYQNYSTNFNDLVNKARVDYFVALVYDGKHTNLTIEALARLSGFGSRQSLYTKFKKFHGGNPSELCNSIKATDQPTDVIIPELQKPVISANSEAK